MLSPSQYPPPATLPGDPSEQRAPTSKPALPQLVSLACHDLRTPLATIQGFARTAAAREELPDRAAQALELIVAAAEELAGLLDDLSLSAQIDGRRYKPVLEPVETLDLARAAAERLGPDAVSVSGAGASVLVDPAASARAVTGLCRCALRHGGLRRVSLALEGPALLLSPVTAAVAPIILGEVARDLSALVAARLVEALGGSLSLAGETLSVRLPSAAEPLAQ